VPQEALNKFGPADSGVVRTGKITWEMRHTLEVSGARAIRIQDIMVRDIIHTNQWKRPICFAVTCSPDSKIGLDDYLWFQGLVWRLEPRPVTRDDMGLNRDFVEQCLMNGPEAPSRQPQAGYRFRGINDPNVVYDENTTRLMLNYRAAFLRLAMHYVNTEPNPTKGVATLERMENLIPRSKIPMAWELMSDVANVYHRFGRSDKFNEYADAIEVEAQQLIESGQANERTYYNPYRVLLDIYDTRHQYQKSIDLLEGLQAKYPNDANLKSRISQLKQLVVVEKALAPNDSAK